MNLYRISTGRKSSVTIVALLILAVCSGTMAIMSIEEANAKPRTRDLIVNLHFDENSGSTACDSSGNNNDGTIYGATWTSGVSGSALSFDGEDDYVEIPNIHLESFSFSAWVKTQIVGESINSRRIFLLDGDIASDHYYALLGNTGGALSAVVDRNEVNEYDWSFSVNTWTHITITYDMSNMKIYKDGVLTETGILSASSSVEGTLYIGGTDLYGSPERNNFWDGSIDEVAIYNRALSATEIKGLFAHGLVHELKNEIRELHDEAFTNPKLAEIRKKVLFRQLTVVEKLIQRGRYRAAIRILDRSIRRRIHSWIVEDWRSDPLEKVDYIISNLS